PAGQVRRDQPLDRDQRGEKSGRPQYPAADTREQLGIRPDCEGKQDRHKQEERDRQQRAAPDPSAAEVASDEMDERRIHVASPILLPPRRRPGPSFEPIATGPRPAPEWDLGTASERSIATA